MPVQELPFDRWQRSDLRRRRRPLQLHLRGRIDRWFCCRDCQIIANCIAEDCTVGDYVFSADTTVYCNVSNADGGTPYRDAGTGCTETVNRFVDKGRWELRPAVDQQGTAAYLATSIDLNRFSFLQARRPRAATSSSARARASGTSHRPVACGLKVSVGTDVAVAAVSSLGVKNYTGGYDLARALDLLVGTPWGTEVALTL